MSLQIIARAGLCLAVAAWIVGQWWNISMSVPLASTSANAKYHGVNATLHQDNWMVQHYIYNYVKWAEQAGFKVAHRSVNINDATHGVYTQKREWNFGVNVFHRQNGIVFIRHWLVVSVFIAVNIALHFIYRKRPEGKPCEV